MQIINLKKYLNFGGSSQNIIIQPHSQTNTIATGAQHSLAISNNGTVVAWGNNNSGQTDVPEGLNDVISISAGTHHSLALKRDGTVVGWGYNSEGQLPVPSDLSNVISISASGYHSLALKDNGTVVAWGYNTYGQLAVPDDRSYNSEGQLTVPSDLSNVISISAGGYHSLALKDNGTVVAWGNNTYGQTNVPITLNNVISISAGYLHSFFLKNDGTVVVLGSNYNGQLNIPEGLNNIISISAGTSHNLALKSDGTVIAWGNNSVGQTTVPSNLSNVVSISAGVGHTIALKSDGTVVTWGEEYSYAPDDLIVRLPEDLSNVVQQTVVQQAPSQTVVQQAPSQNNTTVRSNTIAVGYGHSLVLKIDGTVIAWGDNQYRQCDVPNDLSDVISVAAAEYYSVALKSDGTVIAWGFNNSGQTDVPNDLSNVVSISANIHHCLALKSDGTIVAWGSNNRGQTDVPNDLSNVVSISAGTEYSMVLKNDGTVDAWGDNEWDQLDIPEGLNNVVAISAGVRQPTVLKSDGTIEYWGMLAWEEGINAVEDLTDVISISSDRSLLLVLKRDGTVVAYGDDNRLANLPSDLSNIVSILAGNSHSLALKSDGTIVTWGSNYNGQLNIPDGLIVRLPEDLSNVVQQTPSQTFSQNNTTVRSRTISAGHEYSLVLRNDGTVVAWGLPDEGEADIYEGQTDIPVDLSNVISISAGIGHSLALRNDGTVVGWGSGALSIAPSHLSNVISISAGYEHSLALRNDGTVFAWGYNHSGELIVPSDLSNVISISTSGHHSLALKNNGTVVAWGSNNRGQTDVPNDLSNVISISAGYEHSLALRNDGTVIGFGRNNHGQLNMPEGLNNVISISAGTNYNLVLKSDGTVIAWGNNSRGQSTVPSDLSNVISISAGSIHSLALKSDGTVVVWGEEYRDAPDDLIARLPEDLSNVVQQTVVQQAPTQTVAQLINQFLANIPNLNRETGYFNVDRLNLLDSIKNMNPNIFDKDKWSIKFNGEAGIDQGGLRRDFFTKLADELVNNHYFMKNDRGFHWINQKINGSVNSIQDYEFIGKLFAYVVKSNKSNYKNNINLKLHPYLLNALLNSNYVERSYDLSNTHAHMLFELLDSSDNSYLDKIPYINQFISKELRYSDRKVNNTNNRVELLEMISNYNIYLLNALPITNHTGLRTKTEEQWSSLGLGNYVCLYNYGLYCDGWDEENLKLRAPYDKKDQFIDFMIRTELHYKVIDEFEAFIRGFHSILNPDQMTMLNMISLNTLIVGESELNIDEFLENLEIIGANEERKQFILGLIRQNTNEDPTYLNELLYLITSRKTLSVNSYQEFQKKLEIRFKDQGIFQVEAHTCNNFVYVEFSNKLLVDGNDGLSDVNLTNMFKKEKIMSESLAKFCLLGGAYQTIKLSDYKL